MLQRKRKLGLALILTAWALPLLLIGTVLMAEHWVVLPVPGRDDARFSAALSELTHEKVSGWHMVHILYGDCRCSQRVFDYLLARPRVPDADEQVLLVGEQQEYRSKARACGLALSAITPDELKERYDVESAPLLVITDPAGQVRYAGGYTSRRQGLDYRDTEILRSLRAGKTVDSFPLYGCGVSRELQARLDPIGIKYKR